MPGVLGGVEIMAEQSRAAPWADLALRHAPALLRLGVMLTGSRQEAEDLLQATLLRAGRHSERIARMEAPAAYLRRMLLNEHTSGSRRLGRQVREVSVESAEKYAVREVPHEAVEHRDEAWRWLATLTPRQRAVLVLRYYEDLPDREIAGLLDMPEATVRSHAHRALGALRARLTEEAIR